jgi:hypothetical protein
MSNSLLQTVIGPKSRLTGAVGALVLGFSLYAASANQASLSPGVQQVLKLSQAHMTDDVITSFIRNSTDTYKLSADDVLYLSGQGVSQPVISALLQKTSGSTTATAAPAVQPESVPASAPISPSPLAAPAPVVSQPPQVLPPGGQPPVSPQVAVANTAGPGSVDMNSFQAQLVPYGRWTDVAPYGLCWVPSIQSTNPDWRPYFNGGHWEYTESGWYWSSDYPWGEIVFHYGRWTRTPLNGWVWVPGYDWAPAWVCWRNVEAEGYCGWGPLPPGARFVSGVGVMWDGRVATDADFGLAPDMFVFVPFDHFWVHDYVPWGAPYHRVPLLFRSSVVINGYGFVGGRFFIGGLGRERIILRTHHEVPIVTIGFHGGGHYVPEHRVFERERIIEHERGFDHRRFH